MARIKASPSHSRKATETRFIAYLAEQYPLLLGSQRAALMRYFKDHYPTALGESLVAEAASDFVGVLKAKVKSFHIEEVTPFVSGTMRLNDAFEGVRIGVSGYWRREQLLREIDSNSQRWFYRGMCLTRLVDNRLKKSFLSGELRYGDKGVQGKGFRSLGQEAIYAGAWNLKRGTKHRKDGVWKGDVVGPLIRDLGLFLAFTDNDVAGALNAQMGKSGAPLDGKDLHLGAPELGVLPAAAPLAISTVTVTGMAMAMKLREENRVAVSLIGEGGSSLGEWHEAVNMAGVQRLPMIFCIQNNQTALSTVVGAQSRARMFADKAMGYGLQRLTIDGTDPEAVAAGFAWAAEAARLGGGPVLIELIAMRMCGHAHHDDMLYLGAEPELGLELPAPKAGGYVQDELYARWAKRDPLLNYGQRLVREGVVESPEELQAFEEELRLLVDKAADEVLAREWAPPPVAGMRVFVGQSEGLAHGTPGVPQNLKPEMKKRPELTPGPEIGGGKSTFIEAVATGIGEVLRQRPDAFVFGEDVGPPYGNAFMLLRPLLEEFSDRIINSPLAENAIIGTCVGAGIEGMLPIGEIQFNDFVACGFNQLVNNAAKLYYRTGLKAPMVIRMPWGGLRKAGPYHSQDTSPWFYRTPGLKIVCPSTPSDARALFHAAARDGGPVLFFEHIGLYRDPSIKQDLLNELPEEQCVIGQGAFRRLGNHISLITYGAYVHKALKVAQDLAHEGIECDVFDLRSLSPIDWQGISQSLNKTNRVVLLGEDSKTGSILESLASRIADECFDLLDAPVRVLGALDTPVPYSPSLESFFLLNEDHIKSHIRQVFRY
ncbi:MAG: thiamine pyrophosphate-dependent enzyme [Myxococcota bacterium]|nr:thiamine pyrophosphate-dependent enzyme [Myxococcota bacterium]